MEQYIEKSALVTKIEKRKKEAYGHEWGWAVQCATYDEILSFIDSLPEEPVSEELPHIRHRDTLDEFAYQCAYDLSNDWAKETPEWKDVKTACKLGAQWQKEKMMAKAVDAHVNYAWSGLCFGGFDWSKTGLCIGDKCKLIIVKED